MQDISSNITQKTKETEICIYALIKDAEGLKQADRVISQEQYEIKTTKEAGKIRVRMEKTQDAVRYTQTIKIKDKSSVHVSSSTEYTINIDKEMFDAFKLIATSGMIKTRYIFDVEKVTLDQKAADSSVNAVFEKPDSSYEVDVFSDLEGLTFGWCKIDLEIDSINELVNSKTTDNPNIKIIAKVSGLPFKPEQAFLSSSATPEQKKVLDYLYKEVFTIKNF